MTNIRNIILLVISLTLVIAQDSRPSVAVLDFDAKGIPVSAGIYFYQIQTKEFIKTKKMVILK